MLTAFIERFVGSKKLATWLVFAIGVVTMMVMERISIEMGLGLLGLDGAIYKAAQAHSERDAKKVKAEAEVAAVAAKEVTEDQGPVV